MAIASWGGDCVRKTFNKTRWAGKSTSPLTASSTLLSADDHLRGLSGQARISGSLPPQGVKADTPRSHTKFSPPFTLPNYSYVETQQLLHTLLSALKLLCPEHSLKQILCLSTFEILNLQTTQCAPIIWVF